MAKTSRLCYAEDSIAAMPVGEEQLCSRPPEKPDESIFLDSVSEDFETEVRVPSFGKHKKCILPTVILIRVGTQELLVALMSEWVRFTSVSVPHLMEHGVVNVTYTLQDLTEISVFADTKLAMR